MRKIFGFLIAGVVGIGIGVPIGWFGRKKIAEVQFVETTEEEQTAAIIANGDGHMLPVNKDEIQRPVNIQKAIDGVFGKADIPENLQESVAKDVQNEMNREAGVRQMDTQKVQYFKQWKQEADEIAEKYDTRSSEVAEDPTKLPEDAQEFIDDISEDVVDDEHFGDGRPPIEPAGQNDWDRWESKQDGAYDCVQVYWFDEDDMLSDEDGIEIPEPSKTLGFDARKQFEAEGEDGDPDIRFVYNHKQHAIFRLIRRHTSFSRKRGMEEYGSDYDGDEDDDSEDYLRSRQ